MPLSRLDNFLKNVRGNIIYVSPNDLDATDSIENRGNSMGRPFITIQRALLEASRFSYQQGLDNDRFGKTTIYLGPGEHTVDNRPGWIPDGTNNFRLRDGTTSGDFTALSTASNFDITSSNNILYKLNSIYGGVIIPRGISLVGQDLRKVKIRPLYVPNPENSNIERSALFRVTGGSYFLQVTMFDGDPNGTVYKDYTTAQFVPNFSHHKLTCFEYVDGVNDVDITDTFQSYKTNRTDLDMYYEKVGLAYGTASGRKIEPDYPSTAIDIQPKVDEYRIVGPTGGQVDIEEIYAGDGVTGTTEITCVLATALSGLNVDTTFQISGVTDSDYNGQFVVSEVVTISSDGTGTTKFKYNVSSIPSVIVNPGVSGAICKLDVNTVTGASPYIFNCSLRSVYGMCGMLADGSKASGFKSMVVAQFTGVSLQKDNNAFVKFNSSSGDFDDGTTVSDIHNDADAVYKPDYYNYHIKASNDAVLQLVSIFAVGFSQHFVTESGGDFSVTNSNSNFGQQGLASKGFKDSSFVRDDVGYITNIIPPKKIAPSDLKLEWNAVDVSNTVGIASTSRLYLLGETNQAAPPPSLLQGYRVGAKTDDKLTVVLANSTCTARIVMPDTETNVGTSNQISAVKTSTVARTASGNSISSNTMTFTADHKFLNGESIRVFSDNARLPDGLKANTLYYAITGNVNADQIKIAATPTDATNSVAVAFNELGGTLTVESRVSDKVCGDTGHPVQYDTTESQWYVGVATDNEIYSKVVGLGTVGLGGGTPRTYITRTPDTRGIEDKIYKVRYVVPSSAGVTTARAPRNNYILQESSDVSGATNTEVALLYSPTSVTMSNPNELRNPSFLRAARWETGGTAYYTSEIPHKLQIGAQVKINNVTSTNNTAGVAKSGYNQTFTVAGITSASEFYVTGVTDDPGTFSNDTSSRTTSLPTFQRTQSKYNFYVYESEQISEYRASEQDGVYSLTVVDAANTPTVTPFDDSTNFSYPAPISNLYPQYDRDNPNFNPNPTISYALPSPLGDVDIDEPKNSITRSTIDKRYWDYGVGVGITDIISTVGSGNTVTIYTDVAHGLERITQVSINSAGSGYGNGSGSEENLYNAVLGPSTTGAYATGRLTVNASGEITDVKVVDGGSGYKVGDYINVTGTATTTGWSVAELRVDKVGINTGDTIRVAGVTSTTYSGYNQLYKISGITSCKSITAVGVNTILTGSTTGVGVSELTDAYVQVTGPELKVSSCVFDGNVGLLTVTTVQNHGLRANNSITIGSSDGGNNVDVYNGEFIVSEIVSLNEFVANVGVTTLTPTFTGEINCYYSGLSAQAGTITPTDEQYGGRVQDVYAGITTIISGAMTSSATLVSISNANNFNFDIGDYLRIDDEILRIKTTPESDSIGVFRGLYGTKQVSHDLNSIVKRINVSPVEFRRPSIIRASGHTFEYIGYGPGNYSTALPENQADQLSFEKQILAQSLSSNGGLSVYTAMDSAGDYYIGNKKIAAASGKEKVYNSPVPTITGEDITNPSVVNTDNIDVSRRIIVDGGTNNNILSELNGPVLFSQKVTSTSDEGIEAVSFKMQGDATVSRKYTVGLGTPTTAGNIGDVVYNSDPVRDGTVGWVYTVDNDWYAFGNISLSQTDLEYTLSKVGVGTTSFGDNTFQVGSATSIFSVDGLYGVGIGSTSCLYKLNVNGDSYFNGNIWSPTGIVTALEFHGNGSGLTNLDSIWSTPTSDADTIIPKGDGTYDSADFRVGIGTSVGVSEANLTVGPIGNLPSGVTTSLMVHHRSYFLGTADFGYDLNVSGITTLSDFDLDNSTTGRIVCGVATVGILTIGTGGTTICTVDENIGFGTGAPTAKIHLEGPTRMSSYFEIPKAVTSSSGVVTLDLDRHQTFTITTTEAITQFTLKGITASSSTTFTIKILQGSTAYGVTWLFKDGDDVTLSHTWPGGAAPTVTNVAAKTDIYSFMTFDGGTNLYGIIGGQNFS